MLNPDALLPLPKAGSEICPLHTCTEVLQLTPTAFAHIHSSPHPNATDTCFIDGSSTNTKTYKKVEHPIVNKSGVIEE